MTAEQTVEPLERPVLVWVISIYMMVASAWGLLGIVIQLTVGFPSWSIPDPALREYLENASAFYYVNIAIVMGLSLAGAITLLSMRRIAPYFFTGALIVNILETVRLSAMTNFIEAIGLASAVFGLLLSSAIVAYIWRLHQRGRLR